MKIRYKALICFVVLAALILSWPIFAGVCRVQRVQSHVYSYAQRHYQQPVYLKQVFNPYYYAVGTELQLDAIADRLLAKLEQKQKLAEKLKPVGILSAKCATCHSPGKKAVLEDEAPVFFSETGELTANAEQRASMKTAAHFGAMPPAKELSDDEYLELVKELKP